MRTDMIIIGGGLAGLSTGCYARMNGWRTHIFEHGPNLGGVCTAWRRDAYVADGCIQWLLGGGEGGLFRRVYEELGVIPEVPLRPLRLLTRYEDPEEDIEIDLGVDLVRLRDQLRWVAPEDAAAIDRLLETAASAEVALPVDRPPELTGPVGRLRHLWRMRRLAPAALRFRGSIREWSERHLRNRVLRRVVQNLLHPEVPMLFLPVLLSQLARGQLSRPVGGSGAFRDAVADRYLGLGGEASLNTTVEEILVENERAVGVRLADGQMVRADVVVSTSSLHETAYRLLGGRYLDRELAERLETWTMFEPMALFTFGVARTFEGEPSALIIKQPKKMAIDSRAHDMLHLRIFNDEPSFAPPEHTVVQVFVGTDYEWWASRGDRYEAEKETAIAAVIELIEQRFPGFRGTVRMADMATPLSFWRYARSWRGAYEGWLPTPRAFRRHVPKHWPGVADLHLAGQWVEPGGGVPVALLSGRHLVQILCDARGRDFQAPLPVQVPHAAVAA